MYCSVCGGANPEGARFCATCGRELNAVPATVEVGQTLGNGDSSALQPAAEPAPSTSESPLAVPQSPPILPPASPSVFDTAFAAPRMHPQTGTVTVPQAAAHRPVYPCLVCGATLGYFDFFCKRCRTPRGKIVDPNADAPGIYLPGSVLFDPPEEAPKQRRPNDSGLGLTAPAEIARGWNWGAFWLPFFWGMSHRTYQTLIPFVLLVVTVCVDGVLFTAKGNKLAEMGYATVLLWLAGIPLSLWYGSKGNAWAWQNREFCSVEEFRSVQRAWAAGAIVTFVTTMMFLVVGLAMFLTQTRPPE